MRILIVEPDNRIQKGLSRLVSSISSDYEVIGTAGNGEEGLKLAGKLCPDLIITSIGMDKMNGLEMICRLQAKGRKVQFIVCSSHTEYALMRKALVLGAVDYISEPVTPERLREALQRAEKLMLQERRHIRPDSYSMQELFEQLLQTRDPEYAQAFSEKYPWKGNQFLFVVRTSGELSDITVSRIGRIVQQEAEDAGVKVVTGTRGEMYSGVYGIFSIGEHNDKTDAAGILKRAAEACYDWVDRSLVFTVTECGSAEELSAKVPQLWENAAWNLTVHADRQVIRQEMIDDLQCASFVYPFVLEEEICADIRRLKLSDAQEKLEAFTAILQEQTYHYKSIREGMLCMAAAVMHTLQSVYNNVWQEFSYTDLMSQIRETLDCSHFLLIMKNLLFALEMHQKQQVRCSNPVINEVLGIIETEYNKDLSLELMAKRTAHTPEYLSRLFQKETGVRYSVYCTQVRIDAAKYLLRQEGQRVYETAIQVGYPDVRYFCKVFKKTTGITPGEYQSRNKTQ